MHVTPHAGHAFNSVVLSSSWSISWNSCVYFIWNVLNQNTALKTPIHLTYRNTHPGTLDMASFHTFHPWSTAAPWWLQRVPSSLCNSHIPHTRSIDLHTHTHRALKERGVRTFQLSAITYESLVRCGGQRWSSWAEFTRRHFSLNNKHQDTRENYYSMIHLRGRTLCSVASNVRTESRTLTVELTSCPNNCIIGASKEDVLGGPCTDKKSFLWAEHL